MFIIKEVYSSAYLRFSLLPLSSSEQWVPTTRNDRVVILMVARNLPNFMAFIFLAPSSQGACQAGGAAKFARRYVEGRNSFDGVGGGGGGVFVRNHSYENVFDLCVHFQANHPHFHLNGFARGLVFKMRQRGNSEMAYYFTLQPFTLLTARPWAERGSCFTRDLLLTARPWAERGSCFTRDLLTARPWAERGSCSARDLLVVVVVFFLSVTRPKPPVGQIVIGTESRNL